MTREQIEQLAERIASGVATNADVELYNKLCNEIRVPQKWDHNTYGNKDQIRAEMLAAINAGTAADVQPQQQVTKRPTRNYFRWIKVAAAILLPVAGLALYLVSREKNNDAIAIIKTNTQRFKNNVAPGHGGAVLTLSNGEQIILDSAANGSVASDGGSNIVKKNGLVTYVVNAGNHAPVNNIMSTPVGRDYQFVLPDGSKVWLNAASSITFPTSFSNKSREVSVTGEVYFEVKHIDKLPFIVQQGESKVEVMGTHFNINAYGDEKRNTTTLLEGLIKISSGNMSSLVQPGQQVQVETQSIKLINNADTSTVMAWKNGFFDFKGIPLTVLMKQLSRWYNVEFDNTHGNGELFYGRIPKNTTLADVLTVLELTGKVKFGIEGRKISILP